MFTPSGFMLLRERRAWWLLREPNFGCPEVRCSTARRQSFCEGNVAGEVTLDATAIASAFGRHGVQIRQGGTAAKLVSSNLKCDEADKAIRCVLASAACSAEDRNEDWLIHEGGDYSVALTREVIAWIVTDLCCCEVDVCRATGVPVQPPKTALRISVLRDASGVVRSVLVIAQQYVCGNRIAREFAG